MTTKLTIETFPDKAASAYIRGKAAADPENFGALPAQLKQRAFTVAGIEQMDVLRRIRNAIAKIPEGLPWDKAKKEIAAEISPYVNIDNDKKRSAAAKARAEMQLRTHGFQAFSVSRHQQQTSVARAFPYWMYVTVGDSRVRSSHSVLDGKVLRSDDPWWKTHYPPWDWGCRCTVIALDEEDAREHGITPHGQMPTPERSGSYTFNPDDASLDLDQLIESRDEADWKLFAAKCRQSTVQADGREPETMWELMIDQKIQKTAKKELRRTDATGNERAVVLDYLTGKTLGEATGDANGVNPEIPAGESVVTLHTHPNGDNTPSPADLRSGFVSASKAEYIAAGAKLRRWVWLRTPEPADARAIVKFDEDNKAGRLDRIAYDSFLDRLVAERYIKMEVLP